MGQFNAAKTGSKSAKTQQAKERRFRILSRFHLTHKEAKENHFLVKPFLFLRRENSAWS
jgi:hypothetical protein